MYISEISPVSVKGAVGVSHQFMITFGILIAFVMSIKGVSFICTVIIFKHFEPCMYGCSRSGRKCKVLEMTEDQWTFHNAVIWPLISLLSKYQNVYMDLIQKPTLKFH